MGSGGGEGRRGTLQGGGFPLISQENLEKRNHLLARL